MRKIAIVLFFIASCEIAFSIPSDVQIRQAATMLEVPYEALKKFVQNYQAIDNKINQENLMDVYIKAFKSGDFEKMLALTSSESIAAFGREEINDFYKNNLTIGYEMKYTGSYVDGGYIVLKFDVPLMGMIGNSKVRTKVENGQIKVVLRSIDLDMAIWGRAFQEGI